MTGQVLSLFPDLAPSMVDPPKQPPRRPPTKKERYTPEFEAFWTAYPRKLNCSKLMAFRAWQRLDEEEQALAMSVLPIFCNMMRGKEEQYIPHGATWLNQKRFETIRPQTPLPASPASQIDWARAEQIFHRTGRWPAELGPDPSSADYRKPR